jgi:energy-coupling factor transport system substrate-specific component
MFASYKQTQYNSSNGMPSDEANTITQTRDGYLWIGSYSGLLRFNGQTFQAMKDVNDRIISRVRCLYEDSKRRLWIGTTNDGTYCYENGLIRQSEITHATNQRAISEDKEGRIYVGAAEGVVVYDDRQADPVFLLDDPHLKNHMTVSLATDLEGRIWGVTYDGDVFVLENVKIAAYFPKHSFKAQSPKYVFCDNSGTVFLATSGNTVIRIDSRVGVGSSPESLKFTEFSTGSIENHSTLYMDHEGKLMVCANNGFGFFDKDMKFHEARGGLFNSSIEKIIQDYHGNYWLASSRSGVLNIARSRFTDVSGIAMAPQDVYNAVIKYGGDLYMGADNGLYVMDGQGKLVSNPLTERLKGVRIRYFAKDKQDNLWIAAYNKFGLIRYKDGKWQNWTKKEGLPSNKVRSLLARRNGDVAVGTGDGLVIMRDNAIYKVYSRSSHRDMSNGVILSLCEDPNGNLYAGSDGDGIYKIKPDGTFRAIRRVKNGDSIGSILSMEWDEKRNGMWISNGSFVYLMQDEDIMKIDTGKLNSVNLFKVVPDGDRLSLFSSQMIQSMEISELLDPKVEKTERMRSYRATQYSNTLNSSLTVNACHYYAENEQKLYLACSRNVLALDLNYKSRNYVVPYAVIDSIQIHMPDGSIAYYPTNRDIEIPQDFTQLDIKFSILSFVSSQSELYYYLEGYNRMPIRNEGGNSHITRYSTLPGGDYTFHVISQSRNDPSLQHETSIKLHKKKKLWEERWAQIVGALLALGLVGGIVYLVMKKRAAKKLAEAEAKRKLEEEFTERTILTISNTIDAKDEYTNGHSRRVAQYALEIGRMEGLNPEEQRELYYAGLLHDIGKIAIPDNILNKPSKLTDEEYSIIKSHTCRGADILAQMKNQRLADGAHFHHERFDGKGYPDHLSGEKIPMYGRMIGVADVVDAMYSRRVYKPSINMDVVIEEIKRCAGAQLDPKFAADMVKILEGGFVADENRDVVFDDEQEE